MNKKTAVVEEEIATAEKGAVASLLKKQLAEQERQDEQDCFYEVKKILDKYECDMIPAILLTSKGIASANILFQKRKANQ